MRQAVPHGLTSPRIDRSMVYIDGNSFPCEQGSPWLDIYFDDVKNIFYVVDEAGHHRAGFEDKPEAQKWCQDASIFAAAPMGNADIKKLHDRMTEMRWRLGRYLGACFMWTHRDHVVVVQS